MDMMYKRTYESPETELLELTLETNFLILSVTGKEQDPVGGAEEGTVGDDWGWGN